MSQFTRKALKNMVLRSEIRDPEKTYSVSRIQGVKKAPDTGSGSVILECKCTYEQLPLIPTLSTMETSASFGTNIFVRFTCKLQNIV
jgi:hypothetical protein